MKKHLALAFCLLLAGCSDSDWDHALNYTGLGGSADADADAVQPVTSATTAASAGAPAQAAAPSADLCRAVATQDATSNDFDPATQQRVFARSYAQCLSIYTYTR